MGEDCGICCEPLRKPIKCSLCDFVACYNCFSKFMIECTVSAKCMKCEKPWSRKHLVESFGQYFVSHKYKKKREDVLFDLEKAMLPDTQPLAVRAKKIQDIHRAIHKEQLIIQEINGKISRLTGGIEMPLDSEFEQFLAERMALRMERHVHEEEVIKLHWNKSRLSSRPLQNEKKANTFVVKCPQGECKGYVNTRKMECELCNSKICRECHEILIIGQESIGTTGHTCNPATIETVNLLMKDSKNCPTCKSLIYKIDGCDQMFCTQCHTAFSWRTGEISMGRIHNPHYYEYLRRQNGGADGGREIGDIPCGGLPRATRHVLENRYLRNVHQRVAHVELYEIPRLNNDLNMVHGNVDLRIDYLNGDLNLVNFKREIYKREKALEKKREILTILNTFVVVCCDIFRRLDEKFDHTTEFESIRNFTNENMRDVAKVYKCVVPIIDMNWVILSEK